MPGPARRNPSLSPRERLAAAEAERARWAGKLHDETVQGLASLRMSLAAMEGADPMAAQELIQRAIVDLEREAEKLRGLIVDIRPVALDQLGIGAAIEALADRVEKPKLEVRTAVELAAGEGRLQARLDGEREIAIYRIVQAAVDNSVKHAEASRITVEVIEKADKAEVAITVRDDGNGFDPAVEREGVGMMAMRERVELLGGSIEVRAAIDAGTVVSAVVPSARGISVATLR
jgi:two-component system, NarL family, sensor histidine kinase DevS